MVSGSEGFIMNRTYISAGLLCMAMAALLLGACGLAPANRTPDPSEIPPHRTPEEAETLIRAYLQREKPALEAGFSLVLEELPVEGLWESLHAQVFRASDGIFTNESYLLRDDRTLTLGTSFGGRGLSSILVTDLDSDGMAELLFTYGFGSGIHQSRIGMYAPAYSRDRIIEASVVYYGDLSLSKLESSGAGVRVVEADDRNLVLRSLDPIGTLVIQEHDGQAALVLQVADGLREEMKQNLSTGP